MKINAVAPLCRWFEFLLPTFSNFCFNLRHMSVLQYTPSYGGYSLSGQPPQAPQAAPLAQAFTQPSLFLQTAPTAAGAPSQNELYGSANQMPAYRSQYGQSQQNTIMVSSTTSSLMSTTIKPPNAQSQFSKWHPQSSVNKSYYFILQNMQSMQD